ncbi:MAG: PAS-domain containing protein [Pseudomonadota bacterium]
MSKEQMRKAGMLDAAVRPRRGGGRARRKAAPKPAAAAGAQPDWTNELRIRQAAMLFQQAPVAASVNLIISALTAAVFWRVAPHEFLVPWLALVWLSSLSRIYKWFRLRGRPIRSKTGKRAAARATFWTTACGLMWGVAGFALFPYGTMIHQVFLTFVIGGMAAGAVAAMSAMPTAVYGFLLSALVPTAVRLGAASSPISGIMAAMLTTYLIALMVLARNGHRSFRDGTRIRLENDRLQNDVTAAHAALADAVESSPGALALYDADDRLIIWNKNYQKFFFPGAKGSLAPGLHLETLVWTYAKTHKIDDPQMIEEFVAERLAHRKNMGESWEAKLGDGRWVHTVERRTSSGGTVTISTDITELKTRERDLAAKTGLLEETFENMDQGLVALAPDLVIQASNRQASAILDVPPDRLKPGADFVELLRLSAKRGDYGPGDHRKHVKEVRARFTGGGAWQIETHRPDGPVTEIRGVPSPEGGYVVMYTDISERKRSEEVLRAAKEEAELANRMKSQFLANISHALRTPLNAINGFSQFILREPHGPLGSPRYPEYLFDICHSSDHLLSIINDILDLSKIEAGKFELNEEDVDLDELVRTSFQLVGEDIKDSDRRISLARDSVNYRLFADERIMKQILLNLLSNAVKFTPEGGHIRVSAALNEDGVLVLSIADTGIGMTDQDKVIALSEFGQVENPMTRNIDGTGLGLPLARSLVELHGGSLEIESKIGRGTTVLVALPADRVIPYEAKPPQRRAS